MEGPLVSVITLTRNRGRLIGRCLKSVSEQTYINHEHIVIDGASEDNTSEVVREFAKKDSRVKYIRLDENLPLIETGWKAILESSGEFLCFLDDDDVYLPTKIEKQYNLIKNLPEEYGMVYCWMSYKDFETNKLIKVHKTEIRGDAKYDVVEKPTISGTPTFFIRRDAYMKSGGWREIGLVTDWEFAARFCQRWKVDYVPESLVDVYVNHGSQRMSDDEYFFKSFDKLITFYEYFLREFSEVFAKYPKKKQHHLENLVRCYIIKGDFKRTWTRYRELLVACPTVRTIGWLFYCFYFKLRHKLLRK